MILHKLFRSLPCTLPNANLSSKVSLIGASRSLIFSSTQLCSSPLSNHNRQLSVSPCHRNQPETAIFSTSRDLLSERFNNNKLRDGVLTKINSEIEQRSHGRLFAVVHISGKQFKVASNDIIIVQGYWAPDIGHRIRLEKVLLVGSTNFTLVGMPLIPRDLVRIEGTVIEKTFSHTQLHFVLKKREDYRRLKFYKKPFSMIRINCIEFDGLVDETKDVEGLRETL